MTVIPNVTVAARTNRSGTLTVEATDQGLPVRIDVHGSELKFGAQPLADEILRLCSQAALEAGARRRELLAETGVPGEVLDRLGLPTRETVAAREAEFDARETTPTSWLRHV